MVCGVPIVNTSSPRTKAVRRAYDDEFEDGFTYALTIPAVRKARQAIGRVIRSPEDVGVRVLLDERYARESWDSVRPYLPADGEFQPVSPDMLELGLDRFRSKLESDSSVCHRAVTVLVLVFVSRASHLEELAVNVCAVVVSTYSEYSRMANPPATNELWIATPRATFPPRRWAKPPKTDPTTMKANPVATARSGRKPVRRNALNASVATAPRSEASPRSRLR